ncbi:hypothetical protein HYH02_015341 [Chlamydomonas schloesseri]|uniref:PHD-type domain-containing protein n=1 Tax=Chlamydomonas schloesseri TaxID=2026947 RepID=A0A835SAJ1_9CHLO|nr:hypothetical protein HYH02_015341 [Chlamydomonas schloesseri]|eukprot:KAG2423369.1 hypothetical protein HYH02_015341 [Chlamydomonas schloesseri]
MAAEKEAAWREQTRLYKEEAARRAAVAQEPDAELLGLDGDEAGMNGAEEEPTTAAAAPQAVTAPRGRGKSTAIDAIDSSVLQSCFEKHNLLRKKEGVPKLLASLEEAGIVLTQAGLAEALRRAVPKLLWGKLTANQESAVRSAYTRHQCAHGDEVAVDKVAEDLSIPSKTVNKVLLQAGMRQKGKGKRTKAAGSNQGQKRRRGVQQAGSETGGDNSSEVEDPCSCDSEAKDAGRDCIDTDDDDEDTTAAPGAVHGRDDEPCVVCGEAEPFETGAMLFCDGCDHCYHSHCDGLADEEVPSEDDGWYCTNCSIELVATAALPLPPQAMAAAAATAAAAIGHTAGAGPEPAADIGGGPPGAGTGMAAAARQQATAAATAAMSPAAAPPLPAPAAVAAAAAAAAAVAVAAGPVISWVGGARPAAAD